MSNAEHVYRVHPAIGIARVGNSPEFYLGPETMAGLPVEGQVTTGGLPIRPGTEADTITSSELRDRYGALKRQAARFRIYQYERCGEEAYPNGGGVEITIGAKVGSRTVVDLVWTVHVANKKANWYYLNDDLGVEVYQPAHKAQLQVRNPTEGDDLDNAARRRKLIIDPGPRAIHGKSAEAIRFDKETTASFATDGRIGSIPQYPKSFPDDGFSGLYTPTGKIDTLGELRTDEQGRLLVLGGFGKACGWLRPDGTPHPLNGDQIMPGVYGDVNSNGWFDDTSDGPVSATIVFDDGSVETVHGAWVVSTCPSYAPQTLNVVSLWDDVYDSWVRKLDLVPEIFGRRFERTFAPSFADHLAPIFRSVALQRWNTNLPRRAIAAHEAVGNIKATDHPNDTILTGLAYVRDPNSQAQSGLGAPLMPLSMGDSTKDFLSVTKTQFFFLQQWDKDQFSREPGPALGPGERLDRAVMVNCLGGRFAPGIEMTFIVREPEVYRQDWRTSGGGPFRFRARGFDYGSVQPSQPVLSAGYMPLNPAPGSAEPAPLEPGDATKIMAVPWHTDYSACATHNPAENPSDSSTLYWSWPAQRPVAVYAAMDVRDGKLGPQRYSIRGQGTYTEDLGEAGRYQQLLDMVRRWYRIGVIVQGSAIDGGAFSPEHYLEVESLLDEPEVEPWPMNATVIGT